MDGPGVRKVPEGSAEQRKMEETGCEVICAAPTTPAVKVQVKMSHEGSTVLSQLTAAAQGQEKCTAVPTPYLQVAMTLHKNHMR